MLAGMLLAATSRRVTDEFNRTRARARVSKIGSRSGETRVALKAVLPRFPARIQGPSVFKIVQPAAGAQNGCFEIVLSYTN